MLAIAGTALLCVVALVALLITAGPFGGRPSGYLSIDIDTPYVGQGVEAGTAVVLHGVKVGQVTDVDGTTAGGVQLTADLDTQAVRGLTTSMDIDFRPVNYFGVPGINLVPVPGGEALRDGVRLSLVPKGNFTLSELLAQLGGVSQASLTPQLIQVIDRVTRYTDGLNPLFETLVTVTRAIAEEQSVPTEQLLNNTSAISAALPDFADKSTEGFTRITDYGYYPGESFPPDAAIATKLEYPYLAGVKLPNLADETEDYFRSSYLKYLDLAGNGLFGAVGKLEVSHVDDLLPLVSGLKAITDVTPPLLRPQDIAQKLAELRSRFERLYAGDGTQRAISVRVLLDSLPGVAAPLGISVGGAR
ncbi:MlaD family protein [Mycobacterium kyogaense]|uniref:MlaD family protein n=1 Tax=Mycobacterium kyogaense TaxID=2212479 RepID=UPI001F08C612|nr:MlaD family protein [Mycobacterium kyogaense]